MYCPVCSQQQVSEEMNFCARCGFPLGGVRELIAAGGGAVVVPAGRAAEAQEGCRPSLRRRGVRKGAWIMLSCLPQLLVVGLLTGVDEEFAVLALLPLLCFVVGLARLLYGAFFGERAAHAKTDASQPRSAPATPALRGAAARAPELPPGWGQPVEGFTAQRVDTAEMVRPPSVTENTTRLLDEESDPRRG